MKTPKDLTGQQCGDLTVIEWTGQKTKWGHRTWKCKCKCGKETVITGQTLMNGKSTNCGYCIANSSKPKDLTGVRFGKLVVISKANNLGGKTAWNCKCDCGGDSIVRTGSLTKTNGAIRSC